MRLPPITIDVAEYLPARACRQVFAAVVRRSGGRIPAIIGRRPWSQNRKAATRTIAGAKKAWLAAAEAFAQATGLNLDSAGRPALWKTIDSDPPRRGQFPTDGEFLAAAEAWSEKTRREAGFLRHAAHLPRLRRLLTSGRWSRTGLTWHGLNPQQLLRMCPSPQRWERWLHRVRYRAAVILRPWGMLPSMRQLAELLHQRSWDAGLPRVGKIALEWVAQTLRARFAGLWAATPVPAWQEIAAYRIFRRGGNPDYEVAPVRCERTDLDTIGPQSADDRVSIWDPWIVARSPEALLISSDLRFNRRTIVQAIVRNPADGTRCHLTVPPWFGLPLWEGESAEARIHAAVAWTFGLTPAEYQPGLES